MKHRKAIKEFFMKDVCSRYKSVYVNTLSDIKLYKKQYDL